MNTLYALTGRDVLILTFLLLSLLLLLWRRRPPAPTSADVAPYPVASAADHEAALDTLATLPHLLRCQDGTLINLLSGHVVDRCPCETSPTGHLRLRWCGATSVGLHSAEALQRYLRLQLQLAALLGEERP